MLWLQSKCKTTWQKHVEWALFTRKFEIHQPAGWVDQNGLGTFFQSSGPWHDLSLEWRRHESDCHLLSIYGFLARPWDLRMWAIRFQQISHFSGRSFGTLLTRGKALSRVLCVVLGVFQPPYRMRCHPESLCPGGGGTWGTGNPRGDIRRCSTWWCLAVQGMKHFNAFMLSWKDFDV